MNTAKVVNKFQMANYFVHLLSMFIKNEQMCWNEQKLLFCSIAL